MLDLESLFEGVTRASEGATATPCIAALPPRVGTGKRRSLPKSRFRAPQRQAGPWWRVVRAVGAENLCYLAYAERNVLALDFFTADPLNGAKVREYSQVA
jgi:alkylated DNA nucleotide flippase Atl1